MADIMLPMDITVLCEDDDTERLDLDRIEAIRLAFTWLRRTGKDLDSYPRKAGLDDQMRQEAVQFAAGTLPRPAEWTPRLYHLAVDG